MGEHCDGGGVGVLGAGWLTQRGLPARLVANSGEIITVAGWPATTTAEARQATQTGAQ
jgi:hypothetical protein